MNSVGKKKILYVITKSNWGGAQRYVYDLATAMKNNGHDVIVACGDSRKKEGDLPGLLEQKLKGSGVAVILVPSFVRNLSIIKEFSAFRELKEILEKERPDIVHLNSSKAGGIGALAARLAGVREIVFTSHGLSWDEDRNMVLRAFIFLASYVTFLLSHKIITISKNNYERVRRLPFCKRKTVLIRNGIGLINFKSREDAQRAIAGIPTKDMPWIGTVAEFTRNKGLDYLVESAFELKKDGLSFRLVLIGHGEDLQKIKKQAEARGLYNTPESSAYIDLPGFIPDTDRNLKAFEIFVLTSVKEGLPYVLLEAGQAGLAVVASSVGGIPDIIEDGITGTAVPAKNVGKIMEALKSYMQNPELGAKHGNALQQKIIKEFSLGKMVAETEKLYFS